MPNLEDREIDVAVLSDQEELNVLPEEDTTIEQSPMQRVDTQIDRVYDAFARIDALTNITQREVQIRQLLNNLNREGFIDVGDAFEFDISVSAFDIVELMVTEAITEGHIDIVQGQELYSRNKIKNVTAEKRDNILRDLEEGDLDNHPIEHRRRTISQLAEYGYISRSQLRTLLENVERVTVEVLRRVLLQNDPNFEERINDQLLELQRNQAEIARMSRGQLRERVETLIHNGYIRSDQAHFIFEARAEERGDVIAEQIQVCTDPRFAEYFNNVNQNTVRNSIGLPAMVTMEANETMVGELQDEIEQRVNMDNLDDALATLRGLAATVQTNFDAGNRTAAHDLRLREMGATVLRLIVRENEPDAVETVNEVIDMLGPMAVRPEMTLTANNVQQYVNALVYELENERGDLLAELHFNVQRERNNLFALLENPGNGDDGVNHEALVNRVGTRFVFAFTQYLNNIQTEADFANEEANLRALLTPPAGADLIEQPDGNALATLALGDNFNLRDVQILRGEFAAILLRREENRKKTLSERLMEGMDKLTGSLGAKAFFLYMVLQVCAGAAPYKERDHDRFPPTDPQDEIPPNNIDPNKAIEEEVANNDETPEDNLNTNLASGEPPNHLDRNNPGGGDNEVPPTNLGHERPQNNLNPALAKDDSRHEQPPTFIGVDKPVDHLDPNSARSMDVAVRNETPESNLGLEQPRTNLNPNDANVFAKALQEEKPESFLPSDDGITPNENSTDPIPVVQQQNPADFFDKLAKLTGQNTQKTAQFVDTGFARHGQTVDNGGHVNANGFSLRQDNTPFVDDTRNEELAQIFPETGTTKTANNQTEDPSNLDLGQDTPKKDSTPREEFITNNTTGRPNGFDGPFRGETPVPGFVTAKTTPVSDSAFQNENSMFASRFGNTGTTEPTHESTDPTDDSTDNDEPIIDDNKDDTPEPKEKPKTHLDPNSSNITKKETPESNLNPNTSGKEQPGSNLDRNLAKVDKNETPKSFINPKTGETEERNPNDPNERPEDNLNRNLAKADQKETPPNHVPPEEGNEDGDDEETPPVNERLQNNATLVANTFGLTKDEVMANHGEHPAVFLAKLETTLENKLGGIASFIVERDAGDSNITIRSFGGGANNNTITIDSNLNVKFINGSTRDDSEVPAEQRPTNLAEVKKFVSGNMDDWRIFLRNKGTNEVPQNNLNVKHKTPEREVPPNFIKPKSEVPPNHIS